MKQTIGIIGQGFVGGTLTTVMAERGITCLTYDKNQVTAPGSSYSVTSITELIKIVEQNGESNIFFVCVPTPMYEDGAADLRIVESVLEELASVPGERIAVVKSTVPPGSSRCGNKH